MGWLRTMFLGDVGNRLDIQDNEHRIAKMQRQQLQGEREKASKDRSQDEAIAAVCDDVDQLKVTLSALVNALVVGGAISKEAVSQIVDAIEPTAEDAS